MTPSYKPKAMNTWDYVDTKNEIAATNPKKAHFSTTQKCPNFTWDI